MAARGTRNMDDGEERIEDDAAAEQLRARGRRIAWRTAALAAVVTAFFYMLME